jgi:hypothetical protein
VVQVVEQQELGPDEEPLLAGVDTVVEQLPAEQEAVLAFQY